MHWANNGYFMWYGWVFWLILLGVLVWAVVTILNKTQNRPQYSASGESPADILKKRFAKGEITKEQFEDMKNTIKS